MQRSMCLLLATVAPLPLCSQPPAYRRDGTIIEITRTVDARPVILDIRSTRNDRISKLSDHSPRNPLPGKPRTPGKEVWFPIVDVEQDDGMEIIARFRGNAPGDRMHWNGNFRSQSQPLGSEMVMIANAEHWENAIYVKSASAEMTDFVIRKTITKGPLYFRCLTPDWSGVVTMSSPGNSGVEETIRIGAPAYRSERLVPELRTAELLGGVKSAVNFLLRSQNRNPASPTFGGLYLFYDLEAATFRRSDWIWTWGPAILFPSMRPRFLRLRLSLDERGSCKRPGRLGKQACGF